MEYNQYFLELFEKLKIKDKVIDKLQISSTFVQKESSIFDENIFHLL